MRLAHVAVDDATTRARITDTLHRHGWTVREQPTGFHLLAAIADLIDDNARVGPAAQTELPELLVIDAIARGCAGLTIAAGLRELGAHIPLLLVTRPGADTPASEDPCVRVASTDGAVRELIELISRREGSTCRYRRAGSTPSRTYRRSRWASRHRRPVRYHRRATSSSRSRRQ